MSSRRPLVLMAVLLVLLLGYFARPLWPKLDPPAAAPSPPQAEPLLPGKNSISNLVVSQRESGEWQVSFDYYYRGEPGWIEADVDGLQGHDPMPHEVARLFKVERGSNHATLELPHPVVAGTTRQVVVVMRDPANSQPPLASARVDHLIEWPDYYEYQETTEFWKRSPEQNLERAVALIDAGGREAYALAKKILERLIQR